MSVKMAESSYLVPATAGLADMDKGLNASLGAAAVAARDENLPTEVRSSLREAVRAIEFAKKKIAVAATGVAAARKIMGAKRAD
jgi:hypothetical protein